MRLPVTVCIPVRNEERNLPSCLASLEGRFDEIVIVDSGSTDTSRQIAEVAGAKVVDFVWAGQFPKKRNWTLRNHDFKTPWVLFLDADERVTAAFVDELHGVLSHTPHVGFWVCFDNWFMGRALRHGDVFRKLALFRVGAGEYERLPEDHWSHLDMEVHEHPVLDGTTGEIAARMEHHDDQDRRRYLDKHQAYASWEARRYCWLKEAGENEWSKLTRRQRFKYRHLSKWWLGWLYWSMAYVWKRGFLDGRAGFVFNFLKRRYFSEIRSRIRERQEGGATTQRQPSKSGSPSHA